MTGQSRLQRWRGATVSFLASLRASNRYGRSLRLDRAGRKREALAIARSGLAILRAPEVRRRYGPEGSCLVCLTVQVESLAAELGEPGVDRADIVDSVKFLQSLPPDVAGRTAEQRDEWLGYLESRLQGVGPWVQ
jgi:hypothetical protein